MTITAAADGSALGNPGPMGWAWYIDDDRWAAGGAPHGTNNQGELLAVLELLRATAAAAEPLLVECDSRYVIDSVTKWMPGWKRKGWRKADGKPVLNREILESLDQALRGRDVQFEWVKGHAGHPRNEAADSRANAAASAYQRGSEPSRGPGFSGTPPNPTAPAAPVVTAAPTAHASVPVHVSVPVHASVPVSLLEEAPALFDSFDDDPIEFTLVLTPEEDARLRRRASDAGLDPETFVRTLI